MQRSQKAELAVRLYRGSFSQQDVDHNGKRYKLINIPYYHAAKIRDYVSQLQNGGGAFLRPQREQDAPATFDLSA